MAEENLNEKDEQNKENTFKPSAIQQKACELAGLNWEDYKDATSLMTAVEDKGFKIDGANILKVDGENSSVVEPVNESDSPTQEDTGKDKKELNIGVLDETSPSTPVQENDDWIARKKAYYEALSNDSKIKDYQWNEAVQNGFAASFNGASIHYSSPDDVSVSKEAGFMVFDAMLNEPDNKGRCINFSADMPQEMAIRLYAACLANGNPMGNNAPQFTDAQIKEALGDDYATFKQKMAEREAQAQSQANTQPTKEEIKQAMKNQYEMARLEGSGKLIWDADSSKFKPNGAAETKISDEDFQKYETLRENAEKDKQLLLKQYTENPEEFRQTLTEVMSEIKEGGNYHKISELRTKANMQLRNEEKEDKKARIQENIKATKVALGIITEGYTDSNGVEHKKLEKDALNKFIKDRKITAFTYKNLGGSDNSILDTIKSINGANESGLRKGGNDGRS